MKFITAILLASVSFSALSSTIDPNYNENCAKRYIRASQDLAVIAEAFNNGDIGKTEYAGRVAAVDSTVLALRTYCINENSEAQACVSQTKEAFTIMRDKMDVREVLKGNISRVPVSVLDLRRLIKGSVRGFIRGLRNGNDNICTLDESFN